MALGSTTPLRLGLQPIPVNSLAVQAASWAGDRGKRQPCGPKPKQSRVLAPIKGRQTPCQGPFRVRQPIFLILEASSFNPLLHVCLFFRADHHLQRGIQTIVRASEVLFRPWPTLQSRRLEPYPLGP